MALKTDYKDDVLDGLRKYRMVNNSDGTVSFVDVTMYDQEGDDYGANDINATNSAINLMDNIVDCTTARNVAAKVVTLSGFVLEKNARITVRFTNTGTTNPPSGNLTLNVNNTGAKNIIDGHTNNTTMTYSNAGYFYNNLVCEFIYNGTAWVWLNRDSNTTYTGGTLKTAAAKTGSGSTVTNTIAANTTIDNAIGTLLNNDYAINSDLTELESKVTTNTNSITALNQRVDASALGTAVNIASYTTAANPYHCPSDGYLNLIASSSNSYVLAVINGNLQVIARANASDYISIPVKKGMTIYKQASSGTIMMRFFPYLMP